MDMVTVGTATVAALLAGIILPNRRQAHNNKVAVAAVSRPDSICAMIVWLRAAIYIYSLYNS